MATPTIQLDGSIGELIRVTDHDGTVYNAHKSGTAFVDTSNANTSRIDFKYGIREVSLIFNSQAEVDAFIAAVRLLY